MNRRRFLALLAAVPFAPAALRGWAAERAEALPAPAPSGPGVLAAAIGEPLAVTVNVPPGRTLRVWCSATAVDDAAFKLVEGPTTLAAYVCPAGQHVEFGALLRPTPGSHTYRLVGAVREGALVAADVGA